MKTTNTDNLLLIKGTTLVSCDEQATEITIPNYITIIATSAFYDCKNLVTINFDGTEEQWDSIKKDGWEDGWNWQNCQINCLAVRKVKHSHSMEQMESTNNESVLDRRMINKRKVLIIFMACLVIAILCVTLVLTLTPFDVVYVKGVRYIRDGNYYMAAGLKNSSITDIVIQDNVRGIQVKSICERAFSNYSNLSGIIIQDGIKFIGNEAFADCSNLAYIIIPNSVDLISENTFRNCSNLTIYCQSTSQPSGWRSTWNPDNRPVVWGYTGE